MNCGAPAPPPARGAPPRGAPGREKLITSRPGAPAMPASEAAAPRRTHYTADLRAGMAGEGVTIAGGVLAARTHGAISFLTVRDRRGSAQVVAKSGESPDAAREAASSLKPHSVVAATGTLRAAPKAPAGVEVALESIHVHSRVEKTPPFEPMARTVKNIDTRLELRAVDLRRGVLQDVFLARSAALGAVRAYLAQEEFVEVNTPKLISTATEGGASLFSIFYYHRRAFLAQSPQLYKEQMTMGMGSVYGIANFYRAEKSHTGRHLSEFTSVDVEAAFMDDEDVMRVLEDLVATACADVTGTVEGGIGAPSRPFERVTYAQAVDELRSAGHDIAHGDDLLDSHLRVIGEAHPGFYFLTGWPTALKPFYIMPREDDPSTSHSFDLQHGHLELSSGGTRLHDPEALRARLSEQGLDPAGFGPHLESFSWGMPPHSGWGMGLDRLVALAAGLDNVREAVLYPRDPDRLSP